MKLSSEHLFELATFEINALMENAIIFQMLAKYNYTSSITSA